MRSRHRQTSIATLMEQMAKMTAQREQRELERSLLEMLAAFLDCSNMQLFGVRQADSQPQTLLLHHMTPFGHQYDLPDQLWQPAEPDAQAAISRGLHDRSPWHHAGHIWQVVYQKSHLIGLLVMEREILSPNDRSFLSGMLNIHENYLRLLYDAERDMLTGLLNRRSFDAKLYELLDTPQRQATLALVDIDHFKRINDTFGHIVGDEVLLLLAQLMMDTLGEYGYLYRYGGEEFGIILRLAPEQAEVQLTRLCQIVANHHFPQVGRVTLSIGHVPLDKQSLPAHAVEQADRALYHAKEHGRNQVCAYTQLVRGGETGAEGSHEGDIELF